MRSTRIDFTGPAPVFDFSKVLVGFSCSVQNALVNTGTDNGSDPIFVDRGTDLKKDGAQGKMINATWATHAANFAALRSLSFIQQTEMQSNPFKMQAFTLRCEQVSDQAALLSVQATCVDGTVIGFLATT